MLSYAGEVGLKIGAARLVRRRRRTPRSAQAGGPRVVYDRWVSVSMHTCSHERSCPHANGGPCLNDYTTWKVASTNKRKKLHVLNIKDLSDHHLEN
jgi:hypothetical protein